MGTFKIVDHYGDITVEETVICIETDFKDDGTLPYRLSEIKKPELEKEYVVRNIVITNYGVGLRLEEIINQEYWFDNIRQRQEPIFGINKFITKWERWVQNVNNGTVALKKSEVDKLMSMDELTYLNKSGMTCLDCKNGKLKIVPNTKIGATIKTCCKKCGSSFRIGGFYDEKNGLGAILTGQRI